jgi:hypothetical protein
MIKINNFIFLHFLIFLFQSNGEIFTSSNEMINLCKTGADLGAFLNDFLKNQTSDNVTAEKYLFSLSNQKIL